MGSGRENTGGLVGEFGKAEEGGFHAKTYDNGQEGGPGEHNAYNSIIGGAT